MEPPGRTPSADRLPSPTGLWLLTHLVKQWVIECPEHGASSADDGDCESGCFPDAVRSFTTSGFPPLEEFMGPTSERFNCARVQPTWRSCTRCGLTVTDGPDGVLLHVVGNRTARTCYTAARDDGTPDPLFSRRVTAR